MKLETKRILWFSALNVLAVVAVIFHHTPAVYISCAVVGVLILFWRFCVE